MEYKIEFKSTEIIILVILSLGLIGGFTAWYIEHNKDKDPEEKDHGWWIWLIFSILFVSLWLFPLLFLYYRRKNIVKKQKIRRINARLNEMKGGW